MAELPAPTAEGDLARTPFAHVLLYCHQHALEGTLVVWPEDPQATRGQDRIRIEGGTPVAARFLQRAGALDRGLLPLFGRTSGAYAFYSDTDLVGSGEAVRAGKVDPHAIIAASLRGPSRDDVVAAVLGGFGATPVRVRPGTRLDRFELLPKEAAFIDVVRAEPAAVDALASMCELGATSGRRLLYLLAITKSLEPWSGPSEAPRAPAAATPARGGAPPEAMLPVPPSDAPPRPAADAASAPASTAGPAPGTAGAPRASAVPSASGGARSRSPLEVERPPEPPPGLSPEHAAQWREIATRALEIDRQNYFEMLGIARDAGAESVRKAYFGLVKKWHPDRVPAELAAVKPFAERIFHHLTAAQRTLSDDTERGKYMRSVTDGGGTPESERQLAAILQAAMDQQKAEVLIRRRDYAGAIELLRGAIEMSPEDADAHATLAAALLAQSPGKERVPEMLALVDRALELSPKHDRAHHTRALVLRRAGREAEALVSLEKAAELNPKNLEAVREVRLARMRGGGSIAPPAAAPAKESGATGKEGGAGGGLLSKLFGSKKEK